MSYAQVEAAVPESINIVSDGATVMDMEIARRHMAALDDAAATDARDLPDGAARPRPSSTCTRASRPARRRTRCWRARKPTARRSRARTRRLPRRRRPGTPAASSSLASRTGLLAARLRTGRGRCRTRPRRTGRARSEPGSGVGCPRSTPQVSRQGTRITIARLEGFAGSRPARRYRGLRRRRGSRERRRCRA